MKVLLHVINKDVVGHRLMHLWYIVTSPSAVVFYSQIP